MSIFASGYMSPPSAATVCASVLAMAKVSRSPRLWRRTHAEPFVQACRFDTEGLTVLSHSNGTIVHGWLLKGAPHLVRRSLIVDPVCFGKFRILSRWSWILTRMTSAVGAGPALQLPVWVTLTFLRRHLR